MLTPGTSSHDLSQTIILNKLIAFLKQEKLHLEPEKEKQMRVGYCSGITALILFSLWLQQQPVRLDKNHQPIPRDDFTWLSNSLNLIASWDEKKALNAEEKNVFLRFISLSQLAHMPHLYLAVSQLDFHLALSDTRGREINNEYNIGSRFTKMELEKRLDKIIHENRLIQIVGVNHNIGLIKINNIYYCIDTNSAALITQFSNTQQIAEWIFRSNHYKFDLPSPVGFKTFSVSEARDEKKSDVSEKKADRVTYPSHAEFLTGLSISPVSSLKTNESWYGLEIMTESTVPEVGKFYFRKNNNHIEYTAVTSKGNVVRDQINIDELNAELKSKLNSMPEPGEIKTFASCFPAILQITSQKEHTGPYAEGFTELHMASLVRSKESLDFYISDYEAHAKKEADSTKDLIAKARYINQLDTRHESPLTLAIHAHDKKISTLLMEHGGALQGNHILTAINVGDLDIFNEFLKITPINMRYLNNKTLLMMAAEKGDSAITESLMASKADVTLLDKDGMNALLFAAKNLHIETFKLLLEKGNATPADWTSWMKNAKEKNVPIEKLTIKLIENYIYHETIKNRKEKSTNPRLFGSGSVPDSPEIRFAKEMLQYINNVTRGIESKHPTLDPHSGLLQNSSNLMSLYQCVMGCAQAVIISNSAAAARLRDLQEDIPQETNHQNDQNRLMQLLNSDDDDELDHNPKTYRR